eukprot:COSAG02_NODE_219_length_28538_cov_79.322058_29_plen_202_part_00
MPCEELTVADLCNAASEELVYYDVNDAGQAERTEVHTQCIWKQASTEYPDQGCFRATPEDLLAEADAQEEGTALSWYTIVIVCVCVFVVGVLVSLLIWRRVMQSALQDAKTALDAVAAEGRAAHGGNVRLSSLRGDINSKSSAAAARAAGEALKRSALRQFLSGDLDMVLSQVEVMSRDWGPQPDDDVEEGQNPDVEHGRP